MDRVSRLFAWIFGGDVAPHEVILNTLLVLVGIALLVSLWRMHTGNGIYKKFNLVYLIVNKDGYPDGAKCIEMGTWLLLSWGFIVYVTAKTLPEWYMQTFVVAFVIRGGYGAYLRSKGGPPDEPGTTVVTETAIKTTEVSKAPTAEQKASPFAEPTKGS
jgi:hypothetical protein